ncbi:hypothetical protein BJ742DRAFT_884219 [Cladochytrium replicatum]|nr:hypothetical protein BJ742DRAFT_884219 [Cladochytrium replicatum]
MAAGQASKTIRSNEVSSNSRFTVYVFVLKLRASQKSHTDKGWQPEWSKPLSFEVAGSMFGITIPNADAQSETYLGMTVKEGEGKVTPIEGAGREGVGGFFKDLERAVATKPVLGVFDRATNVAEGIRNTATVFDTESVASDIPVTLEVRPLGLSWFKSVENGRFFGEEYVAHLELRLEDLVAMVTDRRTAVLRIKRLRVERSLPFEDLKRASVDSSDVILATKGIGGQQSESIRIPYGDPTWAKWLHGMVESAFSPYLCSSRL